MLPIKRNKELMFRCRTCGYTVEVEEKTEGYVIRQNIRHKPLNKIVVTGEAKVEVLPKTKIICPRCGNHEAYYWEVQTRSADEPATRFFKCTKCGHVWREYQ